MSFTTPCFIRKNTPELRTNLIQLGYSIKEACENAPFILCLNGIAYTSINPNIPPFVVVDTGKNEKLFLAIAALKDDSNSNQWFTNGKDWALYYDGPIPGFEFFGMPDSFDIDDYHKATVPELTEHFGSYINVGSK